MKKTLSLLLVLGLFVFFSGCVGSETPPGWENGTQNVSQNQTNLTAYYGDNVTADYVLRVDGKVIDTSLESVAKDAGIYNENMTYQPLAFSMLLDSQMINGFVKGMVGMRVGETRNVTVSPEEGYGNPDPTKMYNISRHYNMSVYEDIPMSFFESQNITPHIDKIFPTAVGYVTISNMTNDTVTIQYMLSPGSKFVVNGLPQSVENMTNDTMLIRYDVVENGTYVTTNDQGAKTLAYVTYADNESFILDENNPLAGKELGFEITLRSISR